MLGLGLVQFQTLIHSYGYNLKIKHCSLKWKNSVQIKAMLGAHTYENQTKSFGQNINPLSANTADTTICI
jgi:hypothetical protein